jgi:hypothetical protein
VMPTCLGGSPTNATTFPLAVRKLRPLAAYCVALTACTKSFHAAASIISSSVTW